MDEKELFFKVSSSLKKIVGRELITNKNVAIFELVKNSYDAMAKNVTISFSDDKLVIEDNGIGMSEEDLSNKWLFLGYSEKGNSKSDDGRYYVGSKGIGRFACDRLGSMTSIITKKSGEFSEHRLVVDWSLFEESNKDEFQTIPVHVSNVESQSINQSYTRIVISHLRDKWVEKEIDQLEKLFFKLIDPFESRYAINISIKFNDKDPIMVENNLVNALQHVTVSIEVSFGEFISIKLSDRGTTIYQLSNIKNDTLLRHINIQLTYLNRSAKMRFAKNMGVSCVEYGNVLIYKNGFRIYPIGDPDNDFFGLEYRKNQGFKRYIGNREIIGAISIEDLDDKFVEVSSRDGGFLKNIYTEDLKEQYFEYAQKPLEMYVNAIKWGYSIYTDDEITYNDVELSENQIIPRFARGLDTQYKYINPVIYEIKQDSISETIEKGLDNENLSVNEAKEIIEKSGEYIKEQEKIGKKNMQQLKDTKKQNRNLTRQNQFLKNLTSDDRDTQAEITHHISKYSNELSQLSNDLYGLLPPEIKKNRVISEKIAGIVEIASRLKVFYKLILQSNIEAKNAIKINLYDYFSLYINDLRLMTSQRTKVNLAINRNVTKEEDWTVKADPYEMSVIIDNMYSNAKELSAKYLDILFTVSNGKKQIRFSTDTQHIDNDKFELIFDLGYSTKENGTGIGLYNIKKIVEKNKWDIQAENMSNSEKGVIFTITI